MSDYSDWKRLASAAKNWGGEIGEHRWYEAGCFKQLGFSVPDAEFLAGCEPGAVLALIADNETLTKIFADAPDLPDTDVEWLERTRRLEAERDQLKAEVETLRHFIFGFTEYDAEMAHAYAAMSKEAGHD